MRTMIDEYLYRVRQTALAQSLEDAKRLIVLDERRATPPADLPKAA